MSWSYSKLLDFEQCPYRYKLKHVDRVPEQKSEAADRGTAIHTMAETFVKASKKAATSPPVPQELNKFAPEFQALRDKHAQGLVSLEGEWGFDTNWLPAPYKTAWLRMKADAVVCDKPSAPTQAIVIDFKTGRKFGNEVKHGEQVQLYALATAIRHPTITTLKVELWYLDKDELTSVDYTRSQALSFLKPFDKRAQKIEQAGKADIFKPNPSVFTCKWCPYSQDKGGQCPHSMTTSMTIADYRRKFA